MKGISFLLNKIHTHIHTFNLESQNWKNAFGQFIEYWVFLGESGILILSRNSVFVSMCIYVSA